MCSLGYELPLFPSQGAKAAVLLGHLFIQCYCLPVGGLKRTAAGWGGGGGIAPKEQWTGVGLRLLCLCTKGMALYQ